MRPVKALGLFFGVALLLCAAAPGAVQASWQIGGEAFEEEEAFSTSGGPLEIVVPEIGVVASCAEEEGSGEISGGSGGEVTATLTECTTGIPNCSVQEPIEFKAQLELIESEGVSSYVVLTPPSSSFATLTYTGAECAIAGEVEVSGETCAEVGPGAAELEFRFSQTIASSCGASGLEIGVFNAYIDGIAWQTLTGENAGEIWEAQDGGPATGLEITSKEFKEKETKDAKIVDKDGKTNWKLLGIKKTGDFSLTGAANCTNVVVNMKKGEVCKFKITCDKAGKGKLEAEFEFGGNKYVDHWNLTCK